MFQIFKKFCWSLQNLERYFQNKDSFSRGSGDMSAAKGTEGTFILQKVCAKYLFENL